MKRYKIKSKNLFFLILIIFGWFFIHLILHEFGHAFFCIILGGKFGGISIGIEEGAIYSACYCEEEWKNLLKMIMGPLTPIIITSVIVWRYKNIYTLLINLISLLSEGYYSIIIGSDIQNFASIVGINIIHFVLIFLLIICLGLIFVINNIYKEMMKIL